MEDEDRNNFFSHQEEHIIVDHLKGIFDVTREELTNELLNNGFTIFNLIQFNQFASRWFRLFKDIYQTVEVSKQPIIQKGIKAPLKQEIKSTTSIEPAPPTVIGLKGGLYMDNRSRNPFVDYEEDISTVIKDQKQVMKETTIEYEELSKDYADRYTVEGVPLEDVAINAQREGTLESLRHRLKTEHVNEHELIKPKSYLISGKMAVVQNKELSARQTAFIIWHYSEELGVDLEDVDLDDAIAYLEAELYQSPISVIEHLEDLMDETYNSQLVLDFENAMVK